MHEEEFEQEDPLFILDFSTNDIRLLHKAVCFYLQNWPGHPSCPIDEQAHLIDMKAFLYRAILEDMYNK